MIDVHPLNAGLVAWFVPGADGRLRDVIPRPAPESTGGGWLLVAGVNDPDPEA